MSAIEEIAGIIDRHTGTDGMHCSALPRVRLIRSSRPTEPIHTVYTPTLCLVAQGAKQASLSDRSFSYDAAKFLVVSVDLPLLAWVSEASPERPYLCVAYDLDLNALSELMLERALPPLPGDDSVGLALSEVEPGLLDVVLRLLRLLDTPQDAPVLAPLAEREILYRLLTGAQARMMRHIAVGENRLRQISRAIEWIKHHYANPFSVERLASAAGMSVSSFHYHFKAVTGLSPLQYRTQVRLQQARRLMVLEGLDAANAGFQVGYESPSQFSRDYSRTFGTPPLKDAMRLRGAASLTAAI
ncbi:AraC family transcriptional regulator [Pedomonas mirosovicensis]|uniref:AraC family transcriptional regulator n=1 Tax=Pedomonas mirosovicensis TaxID=2908641 RepID=UPI002169BAC3|nr:AraC family transcriptional regulator [Pedomonas mirosovicensis]MCH8686410.1 AraC family transcriptional regulator [Pedomonas mirosovicensis]